MLVELTFCQYNALGSCCKCNSIGKWGCWLPPEPASRRILPQDVVNYGGTPESLCRSREGHGERVEWSGGRMCKEEGRLDPWRGWVKQQWCPPNPNPLPGLNPHSQFNADLHSSWPICPRGLSPGKRNKCFLIPGRIQQMPHWHYHSTVLGVAVDWVAPLLSPLTNFITSTHSFPPNSPSH